MSQLGTGELDGQMRRTRVNIGPERTGITENLLAPGVTPIGPQSADANLIAQFDQALGITGEFAGQVTSAIRYEKYLNEKEKDAQERIDRGQAYIDASTDLSGDADRVSQLGLDFFDELDQAGQSLEDHADVVFENRTQGMSEAYRERYIQQFKPAYVNSLVSQRRALVEEAKSESIAKLYSAAAGADSADDIRGILDSIKAIDPSLSDLELKAPLLDIARSFADSGYNEGVATVFDVIGSDFATSQRDIINRLVSKNLQNQAQREQDRFDQLDALIKGGTPTEIIQQKIEDSRDFFRTDRPAEDLLLKLRSRDAGAVDQMQQTHLNTTRLAVGLGMYPDGDPTLAAAQIIEDMARDPGDPMFISATAGLSLIGDLEQRLKFDAYRASVNDRLDNGTGLPLTSSYDTAIDQTLADRGLVDALPTENGQAVIRAITDPKGFAYASDKVGRVTSSTRALIAAGLAGDMNDAAQAAEAYYALYRQNPALSEQVVQNMEPLAKIRARFMESRAAYGDQRPWLNPDFMRLRPLDIDRDTLKQAVWAPGDDAPVRDSEIRKQSREQIKTAVEEGFSDTNGWFYKNIVRNIGFVRYALPDSVQLGPISPVTSKAYAEILQDEYLVARSLTSNDAAAMERAKKSAASRFLAENTPVIWDGEIYFSDKAPQTPINFQELLAFDLRENEGWTEEAVQDLVENHTPSWDQANKAWAFYRNDTGEQAVMTGTLGEPVLYDPNGRQDIRSIEEQKKAWEDLARQKQQEKDKADKRKRDEAGRRAKEVGDMMIDKGIF